MSNRQRIKPNRRPHHGPYRLAQEGEQIEVAFIPGATIDTAEAIEAMQQQTHDGLIELTGARRRSGIRWHHIAGRAECANWLRDAYEDSPDHWAAVQEHFFPFLDEYRDQSVLVVADCDVAVGP